MLDVCLLGTGGMMPLPDRWLTSLLMRCKGRMLLVDCGEAGQIPVRLCGWGFKAIDAVLFTHYHADHVAGLPGLLLTLGNSGREEPLILMGPPGIRMVVEGLMVIAPRLPYDLKLLELPVNQVSEVQLDDVYIRSIPVEHWMPCLAYSFEIRRQGRFDSTRAEELGIPVNFWGLLQRGEEIRLGDRLISPEMVMGKPRKGIKVCYCTDTRPVESLVDFIKGSELFICEGMYGHNHELEKAVEKKHMLFSEAALLARYGEVGELWLTHFSPSLERPREFEASVRDIFKNTVVGSDLMKKNIKFKE
ncbi:ribonuclease Z [Ruminiclostridium hungatei]|uniref:Ribonuclease Z n=1 Tax=Ruminiclostridium hungatei TaxID=48256 RepID=A0A1V4SMD2_RUMHU|nr:ribonuclease Z [Ruminiclostridium hungatei]OPX44953.1 ribonuclease Z [Ruminiclostridium hungatei]